MAAFLRLFHFVSSLCLFLCFVLYATLFVYLLCFVRSKRTGLLSISTNYCFPVFPEIAFEILDPFSRFFIELDQISTDFDGARHRRQA